MTYKAALAGLDLGGGKAVILGDPRDKNEPLLRAFGRFVDSLGGRYVTAEDVGTDQDDMDTIRRETAFVTGVSLSLGGSGDPSAATALGVLSAMKGTAEYLWGDPGLANRHVAVAGVGKVGSGLVELLIKEGTRVTVADISSDAVGSVAAKYEVATAPPERLHTLPCDIYAPCALGGILNPRSVPGLQCEAVVGAANNQLSNPDVARLMREAGVLYAPDYMVNAGGIINIAEEFNGYDRDQAFMKVQRIGQTTLAVLKKAEADGTTTLEAADSLAEKRLESVGDIRHLRPDTAGVLRR
jgi:valine dehydrogenase (NAD+)